MRNHNLQSNQNKSKQNTPVFCYPVGGFDRRIISDTWIGFRPERVNVILLNTQPHNIQQHTILFIFWKKAL